MQPLPTTYSIQWFILRFFFLPSEADAWDKHEENMIPLNRCSILKARHTLLNTAAGLEGWARKGCSPSPSAAFLQSPVCHLLPAALHSSILLVRAVVRADIGMGALQQRPLLPGALHIVQQDAEGAALPELCLLGGPHGVGEAELAAHHGGGRQPPAIVAHRAPLAVDENLHPASGSAPPAPPHQPHRAIAGRPLPPALPALLCPVPVPRGSAAGLCRPDPVPLGARGLGLASPRSLGRALQPRMWCWCFHNKFCWGEKSGNHKSVTLWVEDNYTKPVFDLFNWFLGICPTDPVEKLLASRYFLSEKCRLLLASREDCRAERQHWTSPKKEAPRGLLANVSLALKG